jgi:hypothetical protein
MFRSTPLFCLLVLSSCFLQKDLKRREFTYNANGQEQTMHLKVPRGFFHHKDEVDSAGNTARLYYYSNGTVFYAAYLTDTAKQYQLIDYSRNLPLQHIKGGWIFKGMDSTGRYWREIRVGACKLGSPGVSPSREGDFDEALNWVSLHSDKSGAGK